MMYKPAASDHLGGQRTGGDLPDRRPAEVCARLCAIRAVQLESERKTLVRQLILVLVLNTQNM